MWSERTIIYTIHTNDLQIQKRIMGKLLQKYYIFIGLVPFYHVNF